MRNDYRVNARCRQPVSDALREEAVLVNAGIDLHRENRDLYGIRKMWHLMTQAGHQIGRDQVARLMAIAGVKGVSRGDHTTTTTRHGTGEDHSRAADLIKRDWSAPTRPDQWWVADFSYVWTLQGFCYTSFVVDVYSRRILGWRVSMSKTTALVSSAVEQALFTRRRADTRFTATGLVHHSDAGSQYTSIAFTTALVEAGIAPSIGTVGDALDNALMESTIGLYKTELIDRHPRTWTGPSGSKPPPRTGSTGSTPGACIPRSTIFRRSPTSSSTVRPAPKPGKLRKPRPPAEPGRFSSGPALNLERAACAGSIAA